MNISYSKVELYNQCSFKYYLKYCEKWEPDKTFAALLFGISIDKAINYMLLRHKHNKLPKMDVARALFLRQMQAWQGQNELVYFNSEAPEGIDEAFHPQKAVWDHLVTVGYAILDTYNNEIMPQFKKIINVQTKRIIPNGAGDNLVLITDFKAELQDGRIVLFDNKTSSDPKKQYGPTSVKKSKQLAIYADQEESKLCGYIAFQKRVVDGKILWKMPIDEISEEQITEAIQNIDETLEKIKRQEYPKNEKSCWLYGKKCPYFDLCKKNDSSGLKKR